MPETSTFHCRPAALPLIPLLAAAMLFTAGCSDQKSEPTQQTQPTSPPASQAAQPPSAPAPAAAPAATTGNGEAVYQRSCKTCHDTGIANAPKLGDKEAWAPRIAKGDETLFKSVKNGLNAMPPKGTCMNCSDEELRSAIAYLVSRGS